MKQIVRALTLFLLTLGLTATARTIEVHSGTIQSAVDQAKPGDTIEVWPGTYHEVVVIDKPNIHLLGHLEKGEWPVLDGEKKRNDGIIASGSGFTIDNFRIISYKGNGITSQGADNVIMRHLIVENTGIYGIYPTRADHVVIEDTVTSGIADAGIYVGMCKHAEVRRNEVFNNVAGIEIENSNHVVVENNFSHDNAGGILVFTLPGLPEKHEGDVIVRNNLIQSNNHANFGAPGSIVGTLPSGSGLVVLAGKQTVIENNVIRDNHTGGLIFTDMSYVSSTTVPDPAVDPQFKDNKVLDNLFFRNGDAPEGKVKLLLLALHFTLKGADIIGYGKGSGNCITPSLHVKTLGLENFKACSANDTTEKTTLTFQSMPLRSYATITPSQIGEHIYDTVCSGCHATRGINLIGPSVEELQKKYHDNARAMAEFAFAPSKVRSRFPSMPSQSYLGKDRLLAAAHYMLTLKR